MLERVPQIAIAQEQVQESQRANLREEQLVPQIVSLPELEQVGNQSRTHWQQVGLGLRMHWVLGLRMHWVLEQMILQS